MSLLGTYRVYYGFVRADDDNDGFPNCVDKCNGNDNLDADGDGTPDACDPVCTVNAGLDISICPPAKTAQLVAAANGQTWSALAGNPSAASINNSGQVSGLSNEGTYLFVLTQGSCSDTVAVEYVESAIDYTCNDPISGYGTRISDGGLVNGVCLLCNNPQAVNITDGDLNNFIEYNALLSLLATTSLVAVEDTTQTYPAGTRTGFVVSVGGGLLDAAALSAFQIRTYLNGTLQETATTANNLLTANVLAGSGNRQRISFVTTQPFDEVELLAGNVLGLLSSIQVYYAFEENAANCPNTSSDVSCLEILSGSSTYCGMIEYVRTGFTGAACALCELESLGNLIDDNVNNAATLTLTVGALTNASVAVSTRQTIPAGYEAGFAIAGGAQLLDAAVLGGLRLTTYLNGTQQETLLATNPLISATLLGDAAGTGLLRFRTTLPFDEIQLTVQAPVSANVLSNLNIYYAFVRRDTDNDGTPDCYDKCCSGSDNLDLDGNGVPDACDAYADAVDDVANAATNVATNINVLANDNFGADGPGSIAIAFPPSNGMAVVNNNGTPADPSDDYIIYTSAPGFTGTDVLKYRICDSNGSCDEATVTVNVNNPAPLAQNDINNTLINTPVNGNVITNDSDPNGSNLTVTTTPVSGPTNGMLSLNSNGTYNYIPNNNFEGTDQFTYQVCNAQNFCTNATVTINVFDNPPGNDAPVAHPDIAQTLVNTAVNGNVLSNDIDPDKDVLTVNTVPLTPPANGILSLNADGTFTYTPNNNFVGTDQFTYTVCDPSNACDQATVVITIYPDANGLTNDPPFAQDDAFQNYTNTPLNGNVLSNDDDPNNDALTVTTTPVTSPTNGMLTLNNNGTFNYMPNPDFVGTDQFTYQVCDPSNACDVATVYITVSATDAAPIAQDDINNTLINTPVNGNVITNDRDPNGLNLTVTTTPVTSPANGLLVLNSNGTYTYTPNNNFIGTDQFTYQVCDAEGLCDIATVRINVFNNNAGNNTPEAHPDYAGTFTNTPVNGNVLNNDIDPDGNPLTVNTIPIDQPDNGTVSLNANGTFTYTPNNNFTGTDQFIYQVCDNANACDQATVFITVNADNNGNANNPPLAQDDAYHTFVNTFVNGNVLNNDSDPNGNPISASLVTVPVNGNIVLNNNGSFIYVPNNNFTGTDQFIYQTCDPSNVCDQATVYITTSNDPGNPDLTPIINAVPSSFTGIGNLNITVRVRELLGRATTGLITVRIPKDNRLTFTYNPALTTVGFNQVNNAVWSYDGSNPLFHLFTTNVTISASGASSFGFIASYDPQGSSGVSTITATIAAGSGAEINTGNNIDATSMTYFKNQ
ncbi:MAG: Ig-like domain-containing protein [Saprospiraceae bacterium]